MNTIKRLATQSPRVASAPFAKVFLTILYGVLLCFLSSTVSSQTEYTYPEYGDPGEARSIWRRELITLALEATKDEYGAFVLVDTPQMKYSRAVHSAVENKYKNFFFFAIYSDNTRKNEELTFIEFPIELGLLGYRVCLYSKKHRFEVRKELRSKQPKDFSHAQVEEWKDSYILKRNGYSVVEAAKFESLPMMVSMRRVDLLCRGVNEVYDEWYGNVYNRQLVLDQTFALHYEMPVFIYTHRSNTEIIQRFEKGLKKIYQDGSLHALYLKHFKERLQFSSLWNRKMIELENPFMKNLSGAYRQYNVNPLLPFETTFPSAIDVDLP